MANQEHGVLGKATDYPLAYNPSLLFPIARTAGRALLGITDDLPFSGVDRWTAYEVSWLNTEGLPQVAIVEFDFDCASPNIVESKSLKLYLNSFNQSVFVNAEHVRQTLADDLEVASGMRVQVRMYAVADYQLKPANDFGCIDHLPVSCTLYQPEPALLTSNDVMVEEKFCSHLFRSLCPVTGQPDWASVFVTYRGKQIVASSLLQYLVSFRNHQGFHEQCVEQIYLDIARHCQPQQLTVYARFMRRGGLDINPWRSSTLFLPENHRETRQ